MIKRFIAKICGKFKGTNNFQISLTHTIDGVPVKFTWLQRVIIAVAAVILIPLVIYVICALIAALIAWVVTAFPALVAIAMLMFVFFAVSESAGKSQKK